MTLSISSKTDFPVDAIDTFLDSGSQKIVSAALFCKVLGLGGVTSTHNKRGYAILTAKVAPKIRELTLKLRPKNPETYLKKRPKNEGIRNASLSVYMRKLTTQIRKSFHISVLLILSKDSTI